MIKYKKNSNTIRGQSLNIKDEYYFRPLTRPKFRFVKDKYKSKFAISAKFNSNRFNTIKYNCRFIGANRNHFGYYSRNFKKRRLVYYV